MSLSDFTPDTEEIIIKRAKKGDMTFEVRGLSFQDISKIVRVHYDDLEGLFDIYETHGGGDLSYVAMGKFAMALINDAPGLVAHIIDRWDIHNIQPASAEFPVACGCESAFLLGIAAHLLARCGCLGLVRLKNTVDVVQRDLFRLRFTDVRLPAGGEDH